MKILEKKKVLVSMDSDGHLRVFDVSNNEKSRKVFEKILKDAGLWDDYSQEAVKNLEWDSLGQCLCDAGIPQHGRELFTNIEDISCVTKLCD